VSSRQNDVIQLLYPFYLHDNLSHAAEEEEKEVKEKKRKGKKKKMHQLRSSEEHNT
jgi:hypothetical protein